MNKLQFNALSAIILIILAYLILLPFLTYGSTYYHEKAHIKIFNKYDIEANYKPDLKQHLKNFYTKTFSGSYSTGITYVKTEELNKLNLEQKREILLAGIKSDLIIIYLNSFIILINTALFFVFRKESLIFHLFMINPVLILWITTLVFSTISNLYNPSGDLSLLLR